MSLCRIKVEVRSYALFGVLDFGHSYLFRVSCFEFRIFENNFRSPQRAFSRMLVYVCPVQEQAVGDDGNTAHGHGQCRKYRVQLS